AANGLDSKLTSVMGVTASQAEETYQQVAYLTDRVENMKQSNHELLLSLGGNAGTGIPSLL
ncbi:hypothetical protein ACFLZR_00210, partial [Candidatus Neomarinimicrobiota bacterium]